MKQTMQARLALVLGIVVAVGLLANVGRMRAAPAEERVLTVKAADIFTGDLKRIESLFEASSGCVEFEPPDGEIWIHVENQVWLEGKGPRRAGGSAVRVEKPSLLVFSYRGFEEDGNRTLLRYTHGLVDKRGGHNSRNTQPLEPIRKKKPEDGRHVSTSTSFVKLNKPLELKAGQKAMVFAFCENDSFDGHFDGGKPNETVEDQAQRATRALGFVVWWEEAKDK